jgi:hypothetical protein
MCQSDPRATARVAPTLYLLFVRQVEALAETLDATSRVKDALLTSEEWMALRADINLQNWFDAQCFETVTTGTTDRGLNIIWMDSFFHYDNSREISMLVIYELRA